MTNSKLVDITNNLNHQKNIFNDIFPIFLYLGFSPEVGIGTTSIMPYFTNIKRCQKIKCRTILTYFSLFEFPLLWYRDLKTLLPLILLCFKAIKKIFLT